MREYGGIGLRHVHGGGTSTGTLAVDEGQLVWRVVRGPRRGTGFALPLESIDVVGRHQGLDEAGTFVVGVTLGGEFESFLFRPLSGSPRHVTAAERAYREVRRARNAWMTAWREREDASAPAR